MEGRAFHSDAPGQEGGLACCGTPTKYETMRMRAYTEIENCRICKGDRLKEILSLGEQYLTGVFPRDEERMPSKGPLDLVWCQDCGLVQLRQSYSLPEMYGTNYGYRSGLNASMVRHLTEKIRRLEAMVSLANHDLVVDIGSNDATSLKAYTGNHKKVGIDPTGAKFRHFYSADIELIPDFFSAKKYESILGTKKAKLITSIAMFYDLEDPAAFVQDIARCLDSEGLWHFEQSYLPSMLNNTSYDTICHEHIEFYSLAVIRSLLERYRLRIVDVELNDINGGSIAVTACHMDAGHVTDIGAVQGILEEEADLQLQTSAPYDRFAQKTTEHRDSLRTLLMELRQEGKLVLGYGASTKGNVLLQFCGITQAELPAIADVNPDKFGCRTPGSGIPIISEVDAKAMKPDYFLVLPWHFRSNIIEREVEFLRDGGSLIFPLPKIEIKSA